MLKYAVHMDRRAFLGTLIGGIAATAAVHAWPFRVFSFPSEIVIPTPNQLLLTVMTIPTITEARLLASDDLKALTGVYDAALGKWRIGQMKPAFSKNLRSGIEKADCSLRHRQLAGKKALGRRAVSWAADSPS